MKTMISDSGDTYKALSRAGRGEIADRGSRFLAIAAPVSSRNKFQNLLDAERAEFADATHHCWAFRIGRERLEELSGDDGEPAGSAGLPILRVLAGAGIIDAACIVTRYFGGTKLGIGGLMRAYAHAASEAIQNAAVIERAVTRRFKIALPYELHNEFERALIKLGGEVIKSDYEVEVRIIFDIPLPGIEAIEAAAANISRGKIAPEKIER